jgi:DNA polymerase I-like protein with 3'-5' exonuclease and polymerase domains
MKLPLSKFFVLDCETYGLNARWNADVSVYFVGIGLVDAEGTYKQEKYFEVNSAVTRVQELLDGGWVAVGHNLKFDLAVLKARGLKHTIVPGKLTVADTMVMAYHKNTGLPSYSLDALTNAKDDVIQKFFDAGLVDKIMTAVNFWAIDWSNNEPAKLLLADYCMQDVKATLGLYKKLAGWFNLPENAKFAKALVDIEFPMLEVLMHLEMSGARVDEERLESLRETVKEEFDFHYGKMIALHPMLPQLQWKDDEYVPKEITYKKGSYKHKSFISYYMHDGVVCGSEPYVLYDRCDLSPYNGAAATGHTHWLLTKECPEALEHASKTKKGKPQLDKDFFDLVADILPESLPIAKFLKSRKNLETCITIGKHIIDNGRVHSHYNNCLTRTGRLSSSNPNLCNLPRPDKDPQSIASRFRQLFNVEEGNVMLGCDLDRIEVVVLAWYLLVCKDDYGLADVCNTEGSDVHQANADKWGVSRMTAKTLIFLLVYGGGANLIFKRRMTKTLKEAEDMVEQVDKSQPSINILKQDVWAKHGRVGYITNKFGALGIYPELDSKQGWKRGEGERKSFNFLIQRTARDVMHTLVIESLPVIVKHKAKLINIIYDEVLVECPKETAEDLRAELQVIWGNRRDLLPGLKVNGQWNIGSNWNEVK